MPAGKGRAFRGSEPVRGVAKPVPGGRAALAQPWRLGLEQVDVSGGIEVVTTAGGALVAGRLERPREPGLMVEPDAHEEIGGPEARDLSGLEIERVRVLKLWGEAHHAGPVTPP